MKRHDRESLPTADELAFVEKWMETVDRAARGELDGDELDALERAARHDSLLREALDDARALRPAFARMAALESGARLEDRIRGAIDAATPSRPTGTPRRVRRGIGPRPLHRIPAWGWGVAAAATLLLLVLPVATREPDGTAPVVAHEYSETEVQAAAEEMELALAMLSRTMVRTSRRLQEEMSAGVRQTLDDSFRQGFGRTLEQIPYLSRPHTNEEHSGISIPPRDGVHRTLGVALPGERT